MIPRPHRDRDQPDVEAAKAELERVRRQRPDVARLVSALATEKRLNNFTANIVVQLRGGR